MGEPVQANRRAGDCEMQKEKFESTLVKITKTKPLRMVSFLKALEYAQWHESTVNASNVVEATVTVFREAGRNVSKDADEGSVRFPGALPTKEVPRLLIRNYIHSCHGMNVKALHPLMGSSYLLWGYFVSFKYVF